MEIRRLQQQELLPALHLVWDVFAEDVAADYSAEGIAEFQSFIKYEQILPRFQNQELLFLGAFEGERLCGVLAFKTIGHISLFFVRKEDQGKGIGRMLFGAACNYCKDQLHLNRMTVKAAPGSVEKYQHLGMQKSSEPKTENGITYVPMEMFLPVIPNEVPNSGKMQAGVIVGIVAAGVIILSLIVAGGLLIRNIYTRTQAFASEFREEGSIELPDDSDDPMNPDSPLWEERGKTDGDNGSTGEAAGGTDAIPSYEAEDLSYEITADNYTYTFEGKHTQKIKIQFYVNYPKLTGLDPAVEEKVNEAIRNRAMTTVDEIYSHPSDAFKEKILAIQTPVLVSNVNYKVTYASNDFISIVFDDQSVQGKIKEQYQQLRTINIGLKDGKVYEVKDIVTLNDSFMKEWLNRMRSESNDASLLSELQTDEMKKILNGETSDTGYKAQFFFDQDGIEIGYDFHTFYTSDPSEKQEMSFSWVTAPFSFEEIRAYEKDAAFWGFFR